MRASPVLKKMRWKDDQEILLINPPEEMEDHFGPECARSDKVIQRNFMVLFIRNLEELKTHSEALSNLDLTSDVLWLAYPKKSSKKYSSDLSRDIVWNTMRGIGLTGVSQISINEDWSTVRYRAESDVKHSSKGSLDVPEDLISLLQGDENARALFYGLSATNRKEYIQWITGVKKPDTRQRRLDQILDRLNLGLKNPSEKPS